MSSSTAQTPVKLEVFIDFICPWCYLAHGVVEKLQQKHSLDITWSPFPLHPDTPQEGMLLSDLFRGANIAAMHQRLYALMDELGLEHKERERLFNTRKAQELALWAATQPDGDKLIGLLFRAYFVDNRNLADAAVLLDIVTQAGLDQDEARRVLDDKVLAAEVDAAWQRARSFQINGVPAFIGGGYQVSGFQPLAEMERFLDFIKTKV
jgi:predicted DsbA family dithiol-disulfide isomerase